MEELLQASRAPSTLKAYSGLWREFSSFATDLRQPDCPASPALVELFLVWLDLEGRGSRAKAALGAISQEHTLQGQSNPTKGKRLRLVVDGVERDWAKAKDKVLVRDPFPVAAIRHHVEMAQTCRPELWIRDAFLVALGLRTMRRASELSALRLCDVKWRPVMGALSIFIARSKVDQTGKGTEIYIEPVEDCCTCPVRLFWKYLEWRGREKGLLFGAAQGGRLSTQAITSICQRMVAAAGLQVRVSSHSLRVGGATAAMMAGLTREQIMTIGGWSSAAVDRYLPALEMTRLRVSARMGL